jgi:hypothetical protein
MREHEIGRPFKAPSPEVTADGPRPEETTQILALPEANGALLLVQLRSALVSSEEIREDYTAQVRRVAQEIQDVHPLLARDSAMDVWAMQILARHTLHSNFHVAVPDVALQYEPTRRTL